MISTTTNRVTYSGNGSSASFSYPYEFFTQSDLKVFLYGSSLGQIAAQTLNTHYSIGGTPNLQGVYTAGGTVIFTSSIPSTHLVVITRDGSQIQNYQLLQNGQINSVALVQQLDYMTLLIQRLQDQATRAVGLRDGHGSAFDTGIPPQALVASSVICINSSATGFAVGPTIDQISNAQLYSLNAATSAAAALVSQTAAAASAVTASSSALSATNQAVLATSAAVSAGNAAAVIGSSAFWGVTAQSAAVSATNQSVLAASAAVSAGNLVILAGSAALSASNQAVLSGSGALSATNQAVLAASAALSASNTVGTITFPISVPNGGTGTQGATPFAVAVWNGSSAMTTAVGAAGQTLMSSTSGVPVYGSPLYYENLLVNSAFDWWQAFPNGSSVPSGNVTYFADQWYVQNAVGTSSVITVTRTGGQSPQSINGLKFQVSSIPSAVNVVNGMDLWQTLENPIVMSRILGTTAAAFTMQVKSLGNVTQVGMQVFQKDTEAKVLYTDSSLITEQLFTVNSAAFTTCTWNGSLTAYAAGSSGVIGTRVRMTGTSSGSTHLLNNGFIIEQVGLWASAGAVSPTWMRRKRNPDGELQDCLRFFESSYDSKTALGAVTTNGANTFTAGVAGAQVWTKFQTPKRGVPSISNYSTSTGLVGKTFNVSSGGDGTASTGSVGERGYANSLSASSNQTVAWHWVADARI